MATRIYPSNAARGGATTLTGTGSANDIFLFAPPAHVILQNDTAATIYVAAGTGTSAAATQGDEAIVAGGEWASEDAMSWVSIYGVAATHVNGTVTAGIVLYGE